MSLTLPQPPQMADKVLERHLYRVQQLLEQADRQSLKRADVAERSSHTVHTYTGAAAIGQGQDIVLGDTDGGAFTLTLPPVAERFKAMCIKNIGTSGNDLTVDGSGAETIDGSATAVLTDLSAVRIQSDGTQWWIM